MRITVRLIIWTLVLLAAAGATVFALLPRPVTVELATAQRQELRVTVAEDGKTRIREKYVVSAPVAGRLQRIELEEGDAIVAGESLLAVILPSEPAMLDARARAEAQARVQAAEAAQQRAEAEAEQTKLNLELKEARWDRARELLPSNAISREDYDLARTEFLAARQAIRTAEFDIEIAAFELEMARATLLQFADSRADAGVAPFEILAPVSGRVLRVVQESSTVVDMGSPLMELGDPQNLEVEVDVLSTDAVRIKPGAEITIEHWGGESPLKGNVRVIEPAAFTKISSLGVEEQRVNVIADFSEPPDRIASLGDGYRVEARITIEQLADALAVPGSALFRHNREWHVFTVRDGRAVLQPVKIGLQNDTHTEIRSGLEAGDEVIVYPSDQLSDGTWVEPVEEAKGAGESAE
jgi:HlyD family secretion protein